MKTERKEGAFDILMAELMSDVGSSDMLEESMSLNPDRVDKIPLRYRLIALAFIQRQSLDGLNSLLKKHNCAALYSRSLWEASLIFAFLNGYSYKEWKRLRDICAGFKEEQEVQDHFFRNRSISVRDLKQYIDENSENRQGVMVTRHLTRLVEKKIRDIQGSDAEFREFLHNNIEAFSPVREKTRYYFCKYLYYALVTKIEEYAAALSNNLSTDDIMDELVRLFKGVSALKRKQHTPEEARSHLMQTDISPGGIFDGFNSFFFDYVSSDWMTILIDDYGSVESIPDEERHVLAEHLRNYDPGKYEGLSDDEALARLQQEEEKKEAELDAAFSLEESSNRGYQRNRVGENTLRKYIKGGLDIDRTTLLCFLLYFGNIADLRPEDQITEERLNRILLECGFAGLREENDFDYFVLQFLEAEDPVDYLMEEVTFYAHREENFYLYRVYKESYSYSEFFTR